MSTKRWGVAFLIGISLIVAGTGSSHAAEHMAIKANEGQGRVLVMQNMPLNVSIELNPGVYNGLPADWWLFAETDSGFFYFKPDGSWSPGRQVSYQGPLFEFPNFKVLSMVGLPPGDYKIKFALDPIVDGIFNNEAVIAQVDVTIAPFNCTERPTESLGTLSQVQKNFIGVRGNPDFFFLLFSSEQLDQNGYLSYRNNVRRIETWTYNSGSQLVSSVFDNGHFIKETKNPSIRSLEPTYLSPSQFTHCMNKNDIISLMGEPTHEMNEAMGGRMYQYLRYDPKPSRSAATVVLENGLLVSVMAGFAKNYPGITDIFNNE